MNAEETAERETDPGDVVAMGSTAIATIGVGIHSRNQKEIDDPADAEKTESEKPNRASDRSAVIETVRSGEAEDPKQVSEDFEMCIFVCHKLLLTSASGSLETEFTPVASQ